MVLVGNYKAKQVKKLVEYPAFLNSITKTIEADGIKRVSNLVNVIKTVIDKNDIYKAVFNDITFNITNNKDDDEIIASGLKTLNVNFSFKENNKSVDSFIKLNINLNGKNRKQVNQYIAEKLKKYPLVFSSFATVNNFIASNVFDNSTYKNLIDELVLSSSKNNFYFSANISNEFDNNNSKISVNFKIANKSKEQFNEQMKINDGKNWKIVTLQFYVWIGNGEDKILVKSEKYFNIFVLNQNYVHKDFFVYMSKVVEAIFQDIFKYEVKAKIGNKYGELREELRKEIARLTKDIKKPKNMHDFRIEVEAYIAQQHDNDRITDENLEQYYYKSAVTRFFLRFNESEIPDAPIIYQLYIYTSIKD